MKCIQEAGKGIKWIDILHCYLEKLNFTLEGNE